METYHLFYGLLITTIYISLVIAQPVITVTTAANEIAKENNSTQNCNLELDFSYMGLKTITKKFVSSAYVKSLTLQHNNITSFEENTFESLSNLEYLDLSNNELTNETLFSFGEVPSLKSLILDNNFASHVDEKNPLCSNCCGSKHYFDANRGTCSLIYSNMKVTYNYPNLNHLSLRKIYTNSVPSDLWAYFPKLSSLDISENNFENISDSLMAMIPSTVTELILENVKLTSIHNLDVQQRITLLKLNFNTFNTLSTLCWFKTPNTLCLKGLSNLKSLYISSCNIRTIQAGAFRDLSKLIYLDISNNTFEEIPDVTFDFMPNLTGLNISRNSLSKLPKTSMLQNLTILIMDDMKNHLIFNSLEELPELPMLEMLSLRRNRLTFISSTFLNKLPKLRILDLSNNQIASLKSWSWQSNLQKLHLNSNKILDIDDLELSEAKSLELLDLQNNILTSVKLSAFKHMKDDLIFKM